MINVLLVDDEREEREGIAFLMKKYNYDVNIMYASNGQQACDCVRSNNIDVLFTDVQMPIMNGLELAEKVRDYNPKIKIVIFSAYGEFEYAQRALKVQAVSYLLKPIEIDEFKKLMTSIVNDIKSSEEKELKEKRYEDYNRSNIIYRAFTCNTDIKDDNEIFEEAFYLDGDLSIRILDIEFVGNFFKENEDLFIRVMNKYLGESTEYINIYPNRAILILKDSIYLKDKYIEEKLKSLFNNIKFTINDEMFAIISNKISNVFDLKDQLNKIKEINLDTFGYGDRIVFVDDYYSLTEYYVTDIEVYKISLIEAVGSGDLELIKNQNKILINKILSIDKVSKLYIQNLLYVVLKSMYDKSTGIDFDTFLNYAQDIFKSNSVSSLIKNYKEIAEILLDTFSQKNDDDSRITQKIKNIVEKEYMKDISLNYIAETVNLASSYVSYLFKKETGQTLVKYITDVKMSKAKKMLEDGNLKIVDVAHNCGYDNQSYFNRLFKNYYGVTPKQYRENL